MQLLIRDFWIAHSNAHAALAESSLEQLVVHEAIRSLGVICAWYRWADDSRMELALGKLDQLAALCGDRDPFSWLLAKLTSDVAREGIRHSWRQVLLPLMRDAPADFAIALDRYCRNFANRRAQAWPSQMEGILRLATGDSFAICTPTGSGKTSIAEVAILQWMTRTNSFFGVDIAPLCLYLVPSKALAAEVEGKLSRVVRRLTSRRIVVTGLYGGTDWGPTDAWLTADDPTVLICTYEKAEALIRFVGPLFLSGLSLVVFDEAHVVQFTGSTQDLRNAESRSLRLESLGMRLRQLLQTTSCRMIALSAVAAGLEGSLHRWVGGNEEAGPRIISQYATADRSFGVRSTRWIFGSLRFDGRQTLRIAWRS